MKCGICYKETGEDGGVLCEECSQKPRFRYYALLRPPGYAAVPDGWCLKEFWSPCKDIPGTEIHAHGWVEYHKLLSLRLYRMSAAGGLYPGSSVGQSGGFLIRRSRVRATPGTPVLTTTR